MLKYGIHSKAIKITKRRDGLDFFFSTKSHSQKLLDFLMSAVPCKVKESKELISQDDHCNNYRYKYSWIVHIPGVNREDLIILPKKLCKQFGGVNNLNICYKVGKRLHFYDPINLQKFEMSSLQFFNYELDIEVIPFKGNETKFLVNDIYGDKEMAQTLNSTFSNIQTKFAHVEVSPLDSGSKNYCTITHMGHILKHGDTVLGFNIESLNCSSDLNHLDNQKYLPDALVVRKFYDKKKKKRRVWKLKRMKIDEEDAIPEEPEDTETNNKKKKKKKVKKIEKNDNLEEEKDFENFMDELEQNKFLRNKINLFVDEDKKKFPAVNQIEENPEQEDYEVDKEMVKLDELMKEMEIPVKKLEEMKPEINEDDEIELFIQELKKVEVKKL